MEVQLRRLGPDSKVKILKVPKECRTKIWLAGRGTSCQIYTKSKYASRQHFSITYKERKYFISDLQSANGTFLNDEKLLYEKPLTFGSIISVGVPSEMQNSPDCIVFIFEALSGVFPDDKQPSLTISDVVLEKHSTPDPEPPSDVRMDVDPPSCHVADSLNVNNSTDGMETFLNDSSSSDVVIIESPSSMNEPKPAKIRKLNEGEVIPAVKPEPVPDGKNAKDACIEDEDIFAYEALTQVDEPQIKTEPESDLLNYSLTEELIEISDSEDDWSPDLKGEGSKCPEGDEDDDVVVLETIIRSKESIKNDLPVFEDCKIFDELTETDKKWLGRLLNVKKEEEFFKGDDETKLPEVDDRQKEAEEDAIVDEAANGEKPEAPVAPCAVELIRLSPQDVEKLSLEPTAETFPRVEVPQKIIKRTVAKKSVSFDLVPKIRYIEVPSRPKLTASEKGRMRFTRIIFNICNWNTHWLEECKRVAPEKDPPDICEDRLRKIPKKFPTHSDYMAAFIPAMLLHLWNKIKNKWVNFGDSGFSAGCTFGDQEQPEMALAALPNHIDTVVLAKIQEQTVSCDSHENFHAENLSVFKCTGLAQNVSAHKQLIREGHLVLLRLHQVQNPQSATPATEKYSKKLGYLVFGFVESRLYEQFHDQPLHRCLAERCASIVGDLHIVRLTILVKKRPNFQVDKQKLIQLTVVQQISEEIKMFKGICFLPDSPLCAAVLKPMKNEGSKLPLTEPETENLVFKGPLDDVQSEIIRNLSRSFSVTSSLLFGISGAAGTGKGQVIIGLILQLLYGDRWKGKRPKILYCTQWSIPLDEMVVRLRDHSQTMDEPFSLVRVGPVREVKPEVRSLCLSNLASNLRNLDKRSCSEGRKFDAEIEVIKEADVICTTCISSGISKMCAAFQKLLAKNRNQKVICIIDEAMSCREPDSVIPLLLGVTHLILVGDIYQLEPTFSGEKTHSLGFDNSLFLRMYKNFANTPKDLWPIHVLKTQYRMNSSLSKFTSQIVYNTSLQKPTLNASKRIENLKCRLLLVDQTPENLGKDEKENREVRIVSQLMKTISKITKANVRHPVRFAVITCDSKQTENLQFLLPKREFPEVEIDLIQAFQGREFDGVVFVYDGRKIAMSWLATALTRARRSLFIFLSEQSINGNPLFLKAADAAQKHGFLKYVQPDMTTKDWEQIVTSFSKFGD